MEIPLPTLSNLRSPRNRGLGRAVALITMVAWLVSVLNTSCIKPPPAAHLAMAGCAHGESMTDMEMAEDARLVEECANKTCYTALAIAKDGFSIEKIRLLSDLRLPLVFFCVFLFVVRRQAPSVPPLADPGLRRRQIPLIYQFCSLLN